MTRLNEKKEVVSYILCFYGTCNSYSYYTLPKANSSPLKKGPSQKERLVSQSSIFRCELLVSGKTNPFLDWFQSFGPCFGQAFQGTWMSQEVRITGQ